MYYPKSEITANLYTNGGEFINTLTGKTYTGPYYATSDGKYYTGGDYSPTAVELTKYKVTTNQNVSTPTSYTPQPTDNDYTNSFFIRYVIKRVNSGIETIKEVSESDYKNTQSNPLYNTTSFKWKITGPLFDNLFDSNNPVYGVISTNKRTLQTNESKIPGISKYFVNLAQYSK